MTTWLVAGPGTHPDLLWGLKGPGTQKPMFGDESLLLFLFEAQRRQARGKGNGDDEATSAEALIHRILYWADDHPEFDTTFVENPQETLGQYG